MFFPRLVLASIVFLVFCLTTCTSKGALTVSSTLPGKSATLVNDEVEALKIIDTTMGKTDWNFSIDPCCNNGVLCDCTFDNSSICHVVSIELHTQNLSGTLPKELVNLTFLEKISLYGNRLTGSIPEELANLSNLTTLDLRNNQFSGNLPPALGYLSKIETMFLKSNNFTGELPETFANLTAMRQFNIRVNNFNGNIPEFIFQKWKRLELIGMGSGFSGPIPAIDSLVNITDIIITDLNGAKGNFPKLGNLPKLEHLILRSCNLIGKLPDFLGEFKNLETLDVSFNRLKGEIPGTFSALKDNLRYLFLNGNNLTGAVPQWIRETNENIISGTMMTHISMDLSYNNFNDTGLRGSCKQDGGPNYFASIPRNNNIGIVPCLESESLNCQPKHYLYINCGGSAKTVNGTTYEADSDLGGPSKIFLSTDWAFSSTGTFINDSLNTRYILENKSLTVNGDELYTNARLGAVSSTYYAFCLKNATYAVNLHFAEIGFSNDSSLIYSRIFDIYIQGKREVKNFNIKNEAGGVGIPIVKPFNASVTDGTLEIQLRWTAKGDYGPLISAISVFDPNYKDQTQNDGGISALALGGIVAGTALATFLIVAIFWWCVCLRQKSTLERDLKGIELHTSSFSLRQIKAATNNFDAANKIGEGGFGPVYKGILVDGTTIAVKQLSARSRQGNREFVTELGLISALQHPHLVKLYGCCIEGNQLLLIYEYLENNSLARALFGPEEFRLELDWPTRRKICIGIARGLTFLHEESRLKIVHRDIKSTNVLLDKNLNPKISDFGLAKLDEEDNTHISTKVAGTYGYMAPEYAMHGHLTEKADVYSFGIVALEIVSGRHNIQNRAKEEFVYLLEWAHTLKEKGKFLDLIDPRLGSDCNIEEAKVMIDVALLCTNPTAAARPCMSSVVSMLEGRAAVKQFITESSSSKNFELNAETMKELYHQIDDEENMSMQTKTTCSSSAAADFYPVNFSSTSSSLPGLP